MALYQVEVSNASPLLLQLTAPTGQSITVMGWDAVGETAAGQTGRPVLYRPSTAGIARASGETATVTCMSRDGKVGNRASVASVFSVSPSLPATSQSSPNLPYRSSDQFSPEKGIVVYPGQSVCLYAPTDFEGSAGADPSVQARVHTWSAMLRWEE